MTIVSFRFTEGLQSLLCLGPHGDLGDVTVDVPVQGWPGEVGFVTEPLRRLPPRPDGTTAFLCGPELMMRNGARELLRKGLAASNIRVLLERNMQCGMGWCGHRQLGPLLLSATGPLSPTTSSTAAASQGALDEPPTLAVWKFASCDGCQLTLLDCEDELLTIAGQVQIATYLEASRSIVGGPHEVSLVEGSITTAADERRIKEIPEQSKVLVTIGACATASGVQALRNFADVEELASVVYARARIHRHVGDVHSGEYISQLGRNVARHIRTIMSKELACPMQSWPLDHEPVTYVSFHWIRPSAGVFSGEYA